MYQYLILKDIVSMYCDNHYVRQLYSDVLKLRFDSYRSHYGNHSIPTDLYDFIGTHLVITKIQKQQRIPVLAYRLTSKEDCEDYGQGFPYIGHMHAFKTPEEQHIIHQAQRIIEQPTPLAYLNAYAVDPGLAREEKNALIERGLAFYAQYSAECNLSLITAVTDRFKVYRDFEAMGFNYISGDACSSTFTAPHIMHEKFRAMLLTKQSAYAKRIREKYYKDYISAEAVALDDIQKAIA